MISSRTSSRFTVVDRDLLDRREWRFDVIFDEQTKVEAVNRGWLRIRDISEVCFPNELIDAGGLCAIQDPNTSTLIPSLIKVDKKTPVYKFDYPERIVIVGKSGLAFTAAALPHGAFFRGDQVALQFQSEVQALWVWLCINVEFSIRKNHAAALDLAVPYMAAGQNFQEGFLPECPVSMASVEKRVREFAAALNFQAEIDYSRGPYYEKKTLSKNSKWSLQPTLHSISSGHPKLNSLLMECQKGNAKRVEVKTNLRVANNRWLSTGESSDFADTSDPRLVLAFPGDVVVSLIGESPKARVATNEIAVSSNCAFLRPRADVDPERISSFVNSREAAKQWRDVSMKGSFFRSIKLEELIGFSFIESIDPLKESCLIYRELSR